MPLAARQLLTFWEDAREGAAAESGTMRDRRELRRWINDLVLLDLHDADRRLFIRWHGPNVAKNIGNYWAAGYLEDVVPQEAHPLIIAPYFEAMEARRPVYSCIGAGVLDGVYQRFERLILPCIDAQTRQIDGFICWIGPTERNVLASETIYDEPLLPGMKASRQDCTIELAVIEPENA